MSVESPVRPSTGPAEPSSSGGRYRAVWRWHFYAGLIVAPVLLVLAVTGSLYLFKDQYEDWRYQDLRSVRAEGTARPLGEQIEAARRAMPGRELDSVIPAGAPDRSTRVIFEGTGAGSFAPGVSVYVNPYNGRVLGRVDDSATLMRKIRTLHGELMAGTVGDRVVETAACWSLILVASGTYLWWRGPARRKVRGRSPGTRPRLRRLHALVGVGGGAVIVFLVISGLPWSGVWGEGLQRFSTSVGSTSPDPSRYSRESTPKAGDLSRHPDTKVPWAAEKRPVPPSGGGHAGHGGSGSGSAPGVVPVERALEAVRTSVPHCPPSRCDYKVLLPEGERGVYTITVGSRHDPADERTLHIDQYTGTILGTYGWKQYGTLAKAVEQGIALHEGRRYGPANTIVMLGACLALITLVLTGAWMWWKRRPQGALGAPRRPNDRRTTATVAALMLALGLMFPLAGITMLAVLALDVLLIRRIGPLRRRLS